MKTVNTAQTHFLLFANENIEVLKQLAGWLSDASGDLDPVKAAQLAELMNPGDADAAAAFQRTLETAWAQQATALRESAAKNVGI